MTAKKETNKTMDRRELLKALAATGGAVTAAMMLPGKWTKPVIEAGVLPAHAQTSQFTLTATRIFSQTQGDESTSPFVNVEVQMEPPMEGVDISDLLDVGGTDFGNQNTEPTNSEGKAYFQYDLCLLNDAEISGAGGFNVLFTITYSFDDKDTYGTSTDSISGQFNVTSCEG